MNRILLLTCSFLIVVNAAYSQQRPQYSQYMLNNYLLNPAVTGIEDYIDVRLGYRQQWLGITNSPRTFYASAHTSINKNDKNYKRSYGSGKTFVMKKAAHANKNNSFFKARPHHGVGLIAQVDETGPLSSTSISGNYAYHIPVTKNIKLSSGLTVGMIQHFFDPLKATVQNSLDPALLDGRTNSVNLNLGLGGWLYSDLFFIGVSAQQIIPNQDGINNTGYKEGEGPLQRHYFVTGGYKLSVLPMLDIIPSFMVKYAAPSPVAVDINVRALYAQRLSGGISYRHKDAIALMAGMNISPLIDVGYSYDLTTSTIREVSAGSHEIMIGFKLLNGTGVLCPQWMW